MIKLSMRDLFYWLVMVAIIVFCLFTCNKPVPKPTPVKNPIDSLVSVTRLKTDSIHRMTFQRDAAIKRGDSMLALLHNRMDERTHNAVRHITNYTHATDPQQKIANCDSITNDYNMLSEDCAKNDSLHKANEDLLKHNEEGLKENVKMLSTALDTAQLYSNKQTKLVNEQNVKIAKLETKVKGNRKIAWVASGIAVAEAAVIYLLVRYH